MAGQLLSVQDPQASVIGEISKHPDFRVVAAFFLGWVFLCSAHLTVLSPLIRDAFHQLFTACSRWRRRRRVADLEHLAEKDVDVADDRMASGRQLENEDSAFVFILNLCFASAALANLCSLLNLGTHGEGIACTFIIAWGSMASYSVRMTGLLMISWKLRRLGVKRAELYILWFGLLCVLGLVFALNATGTGKTSVLESTEVSICYKQYVSSISFSLSAILMALELYTAIRIVSKRLNGNNSSPTTIDVARPVCLLIFDAAIIIPATRWCNTLVQYIPYSLGALLVIGVFNYRSSTAVTEGDKIEPYHGPRNTILMPSPFLLHFLDTPNPHAPPQYNARLSQYGDVIFHIGPDDGNSSSEESAPEENILTAPFSAPADLDGTFSEQQRQTRHILPHQVKYAERFENVDVLPTGPVVRPPRERPQVFVVTEGENSRVQRPRPFSLIGSDIIRLTPRTPSRKRKDSRLWSPVSTSRLSQAYSSPRDSASGPFPSYNTFGGYAYLGRDRQSITRDSMISHADFSRGRQLPLQPRQSHPSSREQDEGELGPVAEMSNPDDPSTPPSGHVTNRRLTFGQSWKSVKRVQSQSVKSRDSQTTFSVSTSTSHRATFSPRESAPPLPINTLPPLPMTHPTIAGRDGSLGG
ncbi:uncharacterized protein FIBRA_03648 [Fibroporia radiculosa]|uniref:Transmembrane protein n=1 Tax=Fibroporia radiculosa TaxID=599839 RepID=J4G639_9APHY|nr:uncharacterized protein FIBRA_03648 [Fibroporia radiculosa]CCM01588.1 predicted protein [Fibroporia radiculosa]